MNTSLIIAIGLVVCTTAVCIYIKKKLKRTSDVTPDIESVDTDTPADLGVQLDDAIAEQVSTTEDEDPIVEHVVVEPVMINILSLSRVKTKTRQWLLDNGISEAQADLIMSDITKPFNVSGLDMSTAPFKFDRCK